MECEPLSSIDRAAARRRRHAPSGLVSSRLLAIVALLTASTISGHTPKPTDWSELQWVGFNLNWSAGLPSAATSANIDTVTPNSTEIRGAGATALNLVDEH